MGKGTSAAVGRYAMAGQYVNFLGHEGGGDPR